MKSPFEIPFSGETFSCECGADVLDTFSLLVKRQFCCVTCDHPIKISLQLKNGEQLKFQRLDARNVKVGDLVILGHPNLDLRYEILGVNVKSNSRMLGLKGHGGYDVPFGKTICVIPQEWQ